MQFVKTCSLILIPALCASCSVFSSKRLAHDAYSPSTSANVAVASQPAQLAGEASASPRFGEAVQYRSVSAKSNPEQTTSPASVATQAFDRKIIRNAQLDIELDNPADAQRQLTTIAETLGGFVVTSEARINSASNASAPGNVVTVTVRVPAAQFNAAIEKLRGLGGRILQEKISGQDVTEEYIDLEARARTQRALEAQMLDILKRAGKISDALEVQNQIATVRTEIERLEGRQRFLFNQAALSTINITLHTPAPIIIATTAHGFWHQVKQAVGDGIDLASNITLGVIQFVITLIPILLLIVLPLWLVWRLARPYVHWPKRAEAVTPPSDSAAN